MLSPIGLLLWFGWNTAVLASIQLTVRLIRAFSIRTTLIGSAVLTAGSVPITLLFDLVLERRPGWFPLAVLLTGFVGFGVAHFVLRLRRLRARVATALGAALLSAPWPVFLTGSLPR